jgi:hypothetical protein
MKAKRSPKRRFIINPYGVTSRKTAFFIVTALKTSNRTSIIEFSAGYTQIVKLVFQDLEGDALAHGQAVARNSSVLLVHQLQEPACVVAQTDESLHVAHGVGP